MKYLNIARYTCGFSCFPVDSNLGSEFTGRMSSKRKSAKVVVLGDIGRSPRMCYHSLSLAEIGYKVDIIGYGETEPLEDLKLHSQILYHYLMPIPAIPIKLINYMVKTIIQSINLLFLLCFTSGTDAVIVQNPPAIPALIWCWLYARIVGAKFMIDWHNYGHTILALSAGKDNFLVWITKEVEGFIGRRADHNFCVTKAMQDDLKKQFRISATVLYDRPQAMFAPISQEEKRNFLQKFATEQKVEMDSKSGILVSSTSWTEDEDFSVLLSALQEYEDHYEAGNARNLPELLCIITGKGPLKSYYCNKIKNLNWKHVSVITPWLESHDYPVLLACADLGVSLHTSSSGLDLPMKVVDMFGCGLPVCAYNFKCLNELVKNGENSYVFDSSPELAKQILNWFENFPDNQTQQQIVTKFKRELAQFQELRWDQNWIKYASSYFK